MVLRKIVHIDEEKCNGCGSCVPRCAEGALKMINGKARLVSEVYCDGLGACLGECPVGAIAFEERDAEAFDEDLVKKHVNTKVSNNLGENTGSSDMCSSNQVVNLSQPPESRLSHWPIQLTLVPPQAPFLHDADLVIAADCVPFTYANFHNDFLDGKSLVIGCPKLDDVQFYRERLTQILKINNIRSVTVVNMEVPCCFGLYQAVKLAITASGKSIPLRQEVLSVKGKRLKPLDQSATQLRDEKP
jgi:NAD-dependent dihydropyrimidine dehydrogenase PreA subunit